MILWNLPCLYYRPARDARKPFLEEWLEAVGGHWRFAHTAGGLPSLPACCFLWEPSVHICDKEEDHHAGCIATRA